MTVSYWSAAKLFEHMKLCKADGSYLRELSRLARKRLWILDDFGLEVLDTASRLILLEILEDRHGRASSLFTSQLPVAQWHTIIGDPTIADAICDRIVHTAHRIELKGESVRKLYAQREAVKPGEGHHRRSHLRPDEGEEVRFVRYGGLPAHFRRRGGTAAPPPQGALTRGEEAMEVVDGKKPLCQCRGDRIGRAIMWLFIFGIGGSFIGIRRPR